LEEESRDKRLKNTVKMVHNAWVGGGHGQCMHKISNLLRCEPGAAEKVHIILGKESCTTQGTGLFTN
jgi:hypothetical protein